ncbi:MAG TPA: hypothetical protein VF815_06065 [Myxococcaceae bacterium]|jgi:hypothetical protein
MKGAISSQHRSRGHFLVLAAWFTWVPLTALAQPREGGAPAGAAEGQLIDRVVAIIEGQVLTQSELEFEIRVAFIERGAVEVVASPLDEETLRGGLEMVIGQRLLVLSADRLEAYTAEQAEVESRLKDFRKRFESEQAFQAFLARSGTDVKHLTEVLERSVRVARILDSRIRLRAQVGEAQLRDKLFQERYNALTAEELAQVRATAQVRRVAPFARETRR